MLITRPISHDAATILKRAAAVCHLRLDEAVAIAALLFCIFIHCWSATPGEAASQPNLTLKLPSFWLMLMICAANFAHVAVVASAIAVELLSMKMALCCCHGVTNGTAAEIAQWLQHRCTGE